MILSKQTTVACF